jgi:hypothetical protein
MVSTTWAPVALLTREQLAPGPADPVVNLAAAVVLRRQNDTCPAGETFCQYRGWSGLEEEGCVDLQSHHLNCGDCRHSARRRRAATSRVVAASACASTPVSQTAAFPTRSAPTRILALDTAAAVAIRWVTGAWDADGQCGAGEICEMGECVACPGGTTACDLPFSNSVCADLMTDPENCGRCNSWVRRVTVTKLNPSSALEALPAPVASASAHRARRHAATRASRALICRPTSATAGGVGTR